MAACWNYLVHLILVVFLIDTILCTPRYPNAIFRIKNLESNDLQHRDVSRRPTESNIRASANAILLNLLTRVVSAGNLAIIRPAEPLSANTNSKKWQRLGWSW